MAENRPKFNRKTRSERLGVEKVVCNPPCPELGESHLEHQIKSMRDNVRGEDDDKQDPFMVSLNCYHGNNDVTMATMIMIVLP